MGAQVCVTYVFLCLWKVEDRRDLKKWKCHNEFHALKSTNCTRCSRYVSCRTTLDNLNRYNIPPSQPLNTIIPAVLLKTYYFDLCKQIKCYVYVSFHVMSLFKCRIKCKLKPLFECMVKHFWELHNSQVRMCLKCLEQGSVCAACSGSSGSVRIRPLWLKYPCYQSVLHSELWNEITLLPPACCLHCWIHPLASCSYSPTH